jgi:hypothetical protein
MRSSIPAERTLFMTPQFGFARLRRAWFTRYCISTGVLLTIASTDCQGQTRDVVNPPIPARSAEESKRDEQVYTQRLTAPVGQGSVLIKATDDVRPAALHEARRIVLAMMEKADPDVRERLGESGLQILIIPAFKKLTHLPEFRAVSGTRLADGRLFDQVRGVTSTSSLRKPIIATSEENLLRLISTSRSTMHHEFGHAVLLLGVSKAHRAEWTELFAEARRRRLFGNLYAMTSEHEFFAELTQAYFKMSPDFCSRDRLAVVAPRAFDFLSQVYDAPVRAPSAPQSGAPSSAPGPGPRPR